jgi:DNA-binding LacI/PurR family transcriptional regulator
MEITQTELALLAGVSQRTVHRALHGMNGVGETTRTKIRSLASAHGYRLNSAARTMRTGRTGQVGILVLDSPRHTYLRSPLLELIWGVNAGLEAADLVTTLVRLTDVDRPDADDAKIFREHLLDGVIVANMLPDALQRKIERLVPQQIWLDTNIWRTTGCLQRDEVHAGFTAANALIQAGHRRIIHFVRPEAFDLSGSGTLLHYSGEARLLGLHQAAAAGGAELVPFAVPDMDNIDTAGLEASLQSGAGLFIRRMSEARRIASLVLDGALSGGWGQTRSIASADDGADVDSWWPGLARVKFNRVAMGRIAAEMMVALLNGDAESPRTRRISYEFYSGSTIRNSTSFPHV